MISTTIEQSRRLLELGLSPDSADMFWMDTNSVKPCLNLMDDGIFNHRNYLVRFPNTSLPAWSLSALLEVMPLNIGDYDLYITKHKYVDGGHGYNVEYNRGFTISVLHKGTNRDLVIAAYEMVCWLLEQGLIKKGDNDESKD